MDELSMDELPMDEKVRDLMVRHVEAGTVPGAVTLVARPGRDDDADPDGLAQAVGVMALGGTPMRPDAIMRIQSMTKVITAVATLLHVQAGRVRLDDPVPRWLPELVDRRVLRTPGAAVDDTVPATRPITVRDLLANGSGYGMPVADTPLSAAMRAAGVFVYGNGALSATSVVGSVRAVDGAPVFTDGPFAETKEQLLGFFVVECASLEQAIEAANDLARASSSNGCYEIRPLRYFAANGTSGGETAAP